jgi:hypothetical protein
MLSLALSEEIVLRIGETDVARCNALLFRPEITKNAVPATTGLLMELVERDAWRRDRVQRHNKRMGVTWKHPASEKHKHASDASKAAAAESEVERGNADVGPADAASASTSDDGGETDDGPSSWAEDAKDGTLVISSQDHGDLEVKVGRQAMEKSRAVRHIQRVPTRASQALQRR